MKTKGIAEWSKRAIACFDSWWPRVQPLLSSPLVCPRPRLPSSPPWPANGEPLSARGDTVKPSAAADYGAKYWSPPHTCHPHPPKTLRPLIRISPFQRTGTKANILEDFMRRREGQWARLAGRNCDLLSLACSPPEFWDDSRLSV